MAQGVKQNHREDQVTLDYAAEGTSHPNWRRIAGFVILGAGGAFALRLWAEVGYRLYLFFGENAGVRGMNHIGDGGFGELYRQGAVGALVALAGGALLWRRRAGYVMGALILLNLAASLCFYLMHRSLILVEYTEWARMYGP